MILLFSFIVNGDTLRIHLEKEVGSYNLGKAYVVSCHSLQTLDN